MGQQNNSNNNNNNQQQQLLCCPPMTEESELLKKLKPLLFSGIIFYFVLFFLDFSYLKDYNLFLYMVLMITLVFLAINRCFLVFHYYTLATIFLLFGTALPKLGIIIQCKFDIEDDSTADSVIKFLIYLATIVFTCVLYYFCFKGYKEMKYLFQNMISTNPQAVPSYIGMGGLLINTNQQNNYGNNDGNNYNSNQGYQPFSGQGHRVGGN